MTLRPTGTQGIVISHNPDTPVPVELAGVRFGYQHSARLRSDGES